MRRLVFAPVMTISELVAFGASPDLITTWGQDVQNLTDVQERAVRAGALDGHSNLLVVAPTSSGKTFVGEIAAASSALAHRRHAIFIVPFKALAEEHYYLFRDRYRDLLSVVISTGDWSEYDADIRAGNFNLAVMTYEKLMGFLVQQPDILARCTVLIIDEVQTIREGERGAKLEMLLSQVVTMERSPQIVALSASLDDINELDLWLDAAAVVSTERPVPLTQAVCDPTGISLMVSPGATEVSATQLVPPQSDRESLLAALCQKYVAEGKQVLIFRSSVKATQDTATVLKHLLPAGGLNEALASRLNALDDSEAVNVLRSLLASGAAYHNADLAHEERQLVEDAFRRGDARLLVATTTLSMGINLPSDVVIIGDSRRSVLSNTVWSKVDIGVAEYRNAAGRAGRLGQRSAGLSVLLADSQIERRQLLNHYVLGPVEPMESQIPRRPFADLVFGVLAGGLADDEPGALDFVTHTYAYRTFYDRGGGGLPAVQAGIREAITRCVESGLIVPGEDKLHPTQLAKVFSGVSVSLDTATRLAQLLSAIRATQPTKEDVVFEVAMNDETGDRPWPIRKWGIEIDPRPALTLSRDTATPSFRLADALAKPVISSSEIKGLLKATCALEWMRGTSLTDISRMFPGMGAAPVRVQNLGKNVAWLLDVLGRGAQVTGLQSSTVNQIADMAVEARYGLPSRLAPLARLRAPGVARDVLRRLDGYHGDVPLYDPEFILDADSEAFNGILTPTQLASLRQAITRDTEESLQRRRAGHIARADDTTRQIIANLYAASGGALEQAVTDALNHVGLSATRVLRQPHGEEDVQLAHSDGLVVISVTASQSNGRAIKWVKAREVLGTGVGLNPANYVCIGRPQFEALAERQATEMATEIGPRRLLLATMATFAEGILRCAEDRMSAVALGDLLARERGVLTDPDLPDSAAS